MRCSRIAARLSIEQLEDRLAPTVTANAGSAVQLANNGSFETVTAVGAVPPGWSVITNSFGTWNGIGAYDGSFFLHVGANFGAGGVYQDIATVAGANYRLTFAGVGFPSGLATQSGGVQVGTPGPNANNLSQNNNAQLVNATFSAPRYTSVASWRTFTFDFTAISATTRVSFQNVFQGANQNAINVDAVVFSSSAVNANEAGTATNTGTFSNAGPGNVTVSASVGSIVQTTGSSGAWSWSYPPTDGPAQSQVVTVTGTDNDTSSSVGAATFTLVVNNLPPTAVFSNGGPFNEGATGSVAFSSQSDPSLLDTTAGFHYAYDFNNDLIFEIGDGSYASSSTSASATVPASSLADGPGTRTVRGRILDKDGGFTDYTTMIPINNVAPTASFTGIGTQLGTNGSFEIVTAVGAVPPGWSVITNSFGTWNGLGAYDGSFFLHPGANFGAGGVYQDIATVAGVNYRLTFAGVGISSGLATQTGVVQVGTPGPNANSLAQNNNAQLVNATFSAPRYTSVADWRTFTFDFTAVSATTRVSFQNVFQGANQNAINVDAVVFSAGVNEGSTGMVSFSNQSDPSLVDITAGFHYAYDFDNDGSFESGDGTYAGSSTFRSATVPASFLADGPGERTVRGRILDKDGDFTDYTTTLTINNVAPTVTVNAGSAVQLANNGSFETVTAVGAVPPGWSVITNSFGTWNGIAAYDGSFLLHVGADFRAGGVYQDIATVAGVNYRLTFAGVGFSPGLATQTGVVQVGTPGPNANSLAQNNNAQLVNAAFTAPKYASVADWRTFTFDFTAVSATTRVSFQNVFQGDFQNGINIDAVVFSPLLLTVDEGSTVTNSGTFSDPGQDNVTIGSSVGTTAQGLGRSGAWSWSYTPADGPGQSQVVTITGDDNDPSNHIGRGMFNLIVNNVAPTATNNTYSRSQAATVSGNVITDNTGSGADSDPAGANDPLTINSHTLPSNGNLVISADGGFTYTPDNTFTGSDSFSYTISDGDGGFSTATVTLIVSPAPTGAILLVPDTCEGGIALLVIGTTADDIIQVVPGPTSSTVYVTINGSTSTVPMPTGRIIVIGDAGNDDIEIAGGIANSTWLYGGVGNDRLKGGAGPGLLIGGDGNDLILGGSGRDVLVGGLGADELGGNGHDDILIAGFTLQDANSNAGHEQYWCNVLKEWTSTNSFNDRIDNLRGASTQHANAKNDSSYLLPLVLSDNAVDLLQGAAGDDWFIFALGEDEVLGQQEWIN